MSKPVDKVREIIGKLIAAENGGEIVTEQRVLARHPTLADALPDALQSLGKIRSAEVESRAAGAIDQPLEIYSEEELLAPIDFDAPVGDIPENSAAEIRDRIVGYDLLALVGQGGQASVYRARKVSTGGIVAIKVLPGGYFATTRARARFDREVQALVKITHPNVVPVLDRGRTRDGSQFIVMEYIEGLSLDRFLCDNQDTTRIAEIFAKISRAVAELHRCGVVHRDLKPSNVLVDRYGEPHVVDFGLARVDELPGVTDTGQVLGSLPWTSPEQAAGRLEDVGELSDIYSIGVMLAYILDGKHPYPTTGGPLEIARHICSTPPRVGHGRAASPLDGIALKCLSKRPANRYATASELADQFDLVAGGARPRIFKRRKISRRLLWGIAATILLVPIATLMARRSGPPLEQIEPVIELPGVTNSIGMHFLRIPAGDFTMGSPLREAGHQWDEQQRLVHVGSFCLAVTETTQEQYQRVINANPSDKRFLGPNLPVQCVSYSDAVAFCIKLSAIDHHAYRLPTEEEWEYAARASSDAKALSESNLSKVAWWKNNSGGNLHAVQQLRPNQWGLYDMLGAVSEWCSSSLKPEATTQLSTAAFAITKGGSYDAPATSCRSAARRAVPKSAAFSDLGFRVVLEN